MTDYNALDRILHRLALQVRTVSEMSFDMDQRLVRSDPKNITDERHIFVSGLARAGTTVLMRRFHETGMYRSLTYRDMPFVLAPNLARKLKLTSSTSTKASERSHGDRILVNIDSPESLDEVFWRVFSGGDYIETNWLRPHVPSAEMVWKYTCYVNAILESQDAPVRRYLSKNNNNILRLNSIRQAFPRALIFIPFREPLAHAGSLLRQHKNFIKLQAEDPFVKSYMTWLTHHEFGQDHRPFQFDKTAPNSAPKYNTDTIEYWLDIWCRTYEFLEKSRPEDTLFVCYEDLCEHPEVWDRISKIAELSTALEEPNMFSLSDVPLVEPNDLKLAERSSRIYARLVAEARARLPLTSQ
jgi:hypothetical protein